MTSDFIYEALPQRVLFGAGRRQLAGSELSRLGGRRVFVISDTGAGAAIIATIAGRHDVEIAGVWTEVVQHVPGELAERARNAVSQSGADVLVSIGGGSATGLAKAIALSHRLAILAIPTTYAGSEQTTIFGITGERHKRTGKDPIVLPKVVIYDPELTLGLPTRVTGASAFNALAHSVEALYAPGHNPVVTALALEAVRAIQRSLPLVMTTPSDIDARAELMYGAYLSGMSLGATEPAFHHKICHVLGGAFNLIHADAHSVVLPHAIAFNASALPREMAMLAEALKADNADPAGALWDLAVASSVPTSLADLGLRRDDLADAARLATVAITDSPRPFTEAEMLGLLERAYAGDRP